MRVLLLSANTELINMPVLPLGMACIAKAVENAGYKVAQINMMWEEDCLGTVQSMLKSFDPQVIGISIRNIDDQFSAKPRFLLASVKEVVAVCRRHSKARIVLGGPGYSIFPSQVLDYLGVDMGIQGEGERSFLMLLKHLEENRPLADISGLCCRSLGIFNPPAAAKDIDAFDLPDPFQKLLAPDQPTEGPTWVPFQTRRGCPLACSYCSTAAIEGKRIRKRSPEKIIASLQQFVSAGFSHFFLVDNTFNLPRQYAETLCNRIISSGLKIRWRCILYPWKLDETLVRKMSEAGCAEVSLGFESGSDVMLQNINKKFRTKDVRRAAELLKKFQIRRMGFLLLGMPGESKASVRESLEFADSLNLEMVKVTIGPRIYPETALARQAVQAGKISSQDSLLLPKYYFENNMEAWIRATVKAWMQDRPNWIY